MLWLKIQTMGHRELDVFLIRFRGLLDWARSGPGDGSEPDEQFRERSISCSRGHCG